MAIVNTKVQAPVKIKERKNHGPKRHLFHSYSKALRYHMSYGGIFNKYNNFESFSLAVMSRGIKMGLDRLWDSYCQLRTTAEKDKFLQNLHK